MTITADYETPTFISCPVCGAENVTRQPTCFTCTDDEIAA